MVTAFLPARARLAVLLLGLLALAPALARGQDFNGDGKPDILWRLHSTGENYLWLMDGLTVKGTVPLQPEADLHWRIAGSGHFNNDSQRDILWQNEQTGAVSVWLMEGTRFKSARRLDSTPGAGWNVAGAEDFNGDGKTDILWQHATTGQRLLWLMNGTAMIQSATINGDAAPEWKIVAAGKFNADSTPDIVVRHAFNGQAAIWYMGGANGTQLTATREIDPTNDDLDWKIVGAADFSSPPDGKTDLLWRHASLGLNMVYFMNDNVLVSNGFTRTIPDRDWRVASQDTTNSVWRISREEAKADFPYVRARPGTASPSITLEYQLPTNPGFGVRIRRKKAAETVWQTLVQSRTENTYTDTTVVEGERYEYEVYRLTLFGAQHSPAEHVCAGYRIRAEESRGRALLLVDETLAPQLAEALATFESDLIGDGWTTSRQLAPRHDDEVWANNPAKIRAVKALIAADSAAHPDLKAVVILGHVAVPYSGVYPTDGHRCSPALRPDHAGAWSADLFYADMDLLEWPDVSTEYINCDFPLNSNVIGDGKWDLDFYPVNSTMRFMIGRIDFGKMPLLTVNPPEGVAKRSEAELVRQYLAKNHAYRHRLLSWQEQPEEVCERAIFYGHFPGGLVDNNLALCRLAIRTGRAAFANREPIAVGDSLVPQKHPALFGFSAGPGTATDINQGTPVIYHSAESVQRAGQQPTTAFFFALSSFMGDWNSFNDNILKSLLANPEYGLASMWMRDALWRTDAMAAGEPLGMILTRMINNPSSFSNDRLRELSILGDPTLRLHIIAPPRNPAGAMAGTAAKLTWKRTDPALKFFVGRATAAAGPFNKLTDIPLTVTEFSDPTPLPGTNYYMLRSLKLTQSGCATYTNLSQGVTITVKNEVAAP